MSKSMWIAVTQVVAMLGVSGVLIGIVFRMVRKNEAKLSNLEAVMSKVKEKQEGQEKRLQDSDRYQKESGKELRDDLRKLDEKISNSQQEMKSVMADFSSILGKISGKVDVLVGRDQARSTGEIPILASEAKGE